MAQNEYILIVDDDCDIRNLLGIYLENEGYRFIKCDRNSAENISPVLQPPADRGKPAVTRHNIKSSGRKRKLSDRNFHVVFTSRRAEASKRFCRLRRFATYVAAYTPMRDKSRGTRMSCS